MSHTLETRANEIALHVEASTIDEVFEEAADALFELQTDSRDAVLLASEEIRISARNAAALLVAWLNELIFLSETKHRLFPKTIVEIGEGELHAMLHATEPGAVRVPVKKAKTRARVESIGGRWIADVVLDV